MACLSCNWWGWKCMTALTVVEVLVALFSTVSWGTGLTERILKLLVDSVSCTEPCLKVVHLSVHDWQVLASVLYGFAIFFAVLSLLGLLSGQLSLQVPNVVFCVLKITFTIYICEKLLDAQQGPMMYTANRIFMYCTTVWNVITLCFNVRQVKSENERIEMEKSGRRPAEIRPLTKAFAPYFQNCTWCPCGDDDGNTYQVNSNEIRLPIQEDSPDGGVPQSETSAPILSPISASTAVDRIEFPRAVETSIPADSKKHSVVDMAEASLSDVENLDISDKSEGNNVKDSGASRPSKGMDSSKALEDSTGRKFSRDEKYTSGDDSQSGKSASDSRDMNSDDGSEDGELKDKARLLKDR